jgi:cytochrome c-type biogenesis protein CcmH/NrfG
MAVVMLMLALTVVAQDRAPKPVDCSQLLSWMTAGIPGQRLSRLAHERRIAFRINENTAEVLSRAGATADFINDLRNIGNPGTAGQTAECPAELAQAAGFVNRQSYERAESIVRKVLAGAPDNADLHLALGYLRLQQDDLDEAFDEYADAKDLNPGSPEIHNGLSCVFYRSNDAENAIAEARTSLSIDPQNAEGYRYLGLGLYANENYTAALHAFQESLDRDPNRAETYYDTGLTQAAEKDLTAAAQSYQKAIRLNARLIEAQAGLRLVQRELEQAQAAQAERQKPKSDNPSRR